MAHLSPSLVEIDYEIKLQSVLPDRLCALLKQSILTCKIRPGQRLLEKALCAELRVSRTPLREAINRLVFEGLVVPTPYRGYAVAPLTRESIRELCEVRWINEPAAAALAAQRLADADFVKLGDLASVPWVQGDRDMYASYLRANSGFHLGVVRCTGNRRLEGIVMAALDQLQRAEYLGLGIGVQDPDSVRREHQEILDAMRARDPDLAGRRMANHISHSEHRIIEALEATDYWTTGETNHS